MGKYKLLITGCRGQLGSDLMKVFATDFDIHGVEIDDFDITDAGATRKAIKSFSPDIVLHTAAYTNVDDCEANPKLAMVVNATGTENIALACKETGARLIYYSTDYVFSGEKNSPYIETDLPDPKTVYGRSKLEGEKAVADLLSDYVILRLAWVYGTHGKNFVRTMIKLGWDQNKSVREGEIITPLKVVDDQIGNPTWTWEIARQTRQVIESDLTGIVHCTAGGETSWFGFAQKVFEILGMNVLMKPCATAEYPRPAPRPLYSSLENRRLEEAGINIMKNYHEALKEFLTCQKRVLLPCDAT